MSDYFRGTSTSKIEGHESKSKELQKAETTLFCPKTKKNFLFANCNLVL